MLVSTSNCFINRMHILGKEALEPKEEADVATWYSSWGPGWDRSDSWHLHPRHDHRDPGLGGAKDPQQIPDIRQTQEEYRHHQWGHCLGRVKLACYKNAENYLLCLDLRVSPCRWPGCLHRCAHPPSLRLWRSAYLSLQVWRLRGSHHHKWR